MKTQLTKRDLRQIIKKEYLGKNKTRKILAKELGLTLSQFKQKLRELKIFKKPSFSLAPEIKKCFNKKWLHKKYIEEDLSVEKIAKLLGVSHTSVTYWMRKFGIPKRNLNQASKWFYLKRNKPRFRYLKRKWLKYQYCILGRQIKEIAKECHVDSVTILDYLKRFNLWHKKLYIPSFRHTHGYIFIRVKTHPNSDKYHWVPRHRYRMSLFLGRPLRSDELVHHIDGNKKNDKIENLFLTTRREHHFQNKDYLLFQLWKNKIKNPIKAKKFFDRFKKYEKAILLMEKKHKILNAKI